MSKRKKVSIVIYIYMLLQLKGIEKQTKYTHQLSKKHEVKR